MDELEAAEQGLLNALQRGDPTGIAAFLRDDFLVTTAGWLPEPVGKEVWLGSLAGRMTLERFDLRILATRTYGNVSVVLVESAQEGTHEGRPFAMTFHYTDVWVRDGDGWLLAARHASGAPS